MKKWYVGLLAVLIAGCSRVSASENSRIAKAANLEALPSVSQSVDAESSNLPNLGAAPELENQVWLNVDHPLRLASLHGTVVLLEMWTFDCINCQHVIPDLEGWYEQYRSQGLVIIGNHYPEFSYEADLNNLKEAVARLKITYPVAQDNQGKTWDAYDNHYWPALYLIDKQGNIRYRYIGEGNYSETERAIQSLLAEKYP